METERQLIQENVREKIVEKGRSAASGLNSERLQPEKQSKLTGLSSSLLLSSAALGCLFLWIQSQSVNFKQHSQYLTYLRQIQEVDAQINQNVLLAKDGLLTYYDPIVQEITVVEQLQAELKQFPAFVHPQGQQELEQLLQTQDKTWREKERLIQQFLSRNAVLRNSLSYLPVSAAMVIERGRTNPLLSSQLNELLRNILLFNLSNDEALAPQIEQEMQQLLATPDLAESRVDVENTIAHARQILTNRPVVGNFVNQIMALPIYEQNEAILQTYDRYYEQSLRKSNTYRLGFYLLSTVLLIGIAANIISKLRRSALAIQQNETKFRNIFENSQIGIFRTRIEDGLILDANQQFATMLGFDSANDIVERRRSAEFYVNLSDRQRAVEILRTHGGIHNFETQFYRRDGSTFWILYSARQNAAEGYMEGVVADISERKLAEEERQQAEATNRALINAIPDLLLRVRSDGTYLDVLHSSQFQVINRNRLLAGATVYDSLPPDRAQERMHYIEQALQTRELQIYEQQIVIEGQPRVEEVRVVGIRDNEALVMVRDITDRKQAEELLRQSVEAAEAANRSKSIFLANMSHELRTPLNVILGFTQLMIRGGTFNAQQQEQLNTINRSGEHLLTLINDVLEMSKIEAGRVTLNASDFDLHSLLDWLYQMFQIKAQSKGLRLTFEQTSDLPNYIRTDETKLRQVLVNLIGNAVKFTSQGGITLRVSWLPGSASGEINSDGNQTQISTRELITLRFTVEDTGPGIAAEELDRLFKPFVQTDTGHKAQEGTGLGLAISQKFAQLMGGEITVQSTPGSGSVFLFQVEAEVVESGKLLPSATIRQVVGLAAGQEQYRILVVEDKPENRQILRELLVPVGFQVQEAVNGVEGITQWQAGQPHLIWMDIRMPVMDGYESTRQIKAACAEQGIEPPVIIALTGSVFEQDRQLALSVGCNDFVRKPFRAEEIFEKMTEFLGVQYVYADSPLLTTHHSSAQMGETALTTTAANLAAMPPEWIKQLHQAAANVNSKLVLKLIESIPEEKNFLATALTQLVDDFCFEEIVELTQQSGET